jgi:hypothetical protein
LEAQKIEKGKENSEQKEQCWRYHNTWLQTIIKSHSNKNSMVLAQKQIWRPVEQNRKPRYESTQLQLPQTGFWQRGQKHMMEKRQPLQQKFLGKLDICLQKTETISMFSSFFLFFIHLFTCAYIVWAIVPPCPSPTPYPPTLSCFQVEPVLPLSLIFLKRKHKQ